MAITEQDAIKAAVSLASASRRSGKLLQQAGLIVYISPHQQILEYCAERTAIA